MKARLEQLVAWWASPVPLEGKARLGCCGGGKSGHSASSETDQTVCLHALNATLHSASCTSVIVSSRRRLQSHLLRLCFLLSKASPSLVPFVPSSNKTGRALQLALAGAPCEQALTSKKESWQRQQAVAAGRLGCPLCKRRTLRRPEAPLSAHTTLQNNPRRKSPAIR